jgi:hypothetical protein
MNPEAWQDGVVRSPTIDGRDLHALVEQMRAMVPHYTPEWRFSPEDPDAGTALFYLVAEMLGENIKRLNRVPLNNFIAFLDLLQVKLQPARPARTHVVFALNDGAKQPVYVPSGTLLTAVPDDGGEELPFETEGALLITPARMMELFNVHPERDVIVLSSEPYDDLLAEGTMPEVPLYSVEGDNLQEHVLYIRNDDLLFLDHPTKLTLKWHNSERRYVEGELASIFSRTDWLEWSYSQGSEWIPFEKVTAHGQEITLRKIASGAVESAEVNGVSGRWIRCRVKSDAAGASGQPVLKVIPEMDRVTMRASHDLLLDPQAIPPSELYFNDTELEKSGFYPFGEHSMPYSIFYAACPEAFSKRGSRITMTFNAHNVPNVLRVGPDPEVRWKMVMRTADFEKNPPPRLFIRRVQWEYWNGVNWMRLPESGSFEELFAGLPEEQAEVTLNFPCPDDMAATFVNGRENCWIRIRVAATDPVTAPLVEYMSPRLEKMSFSYAYSASTAIEPENAFTLNNVDLTDVTATVKQGGDTFKPFLPIPCPAPSVYMAFDVPPIKGPIRIQFTLGRKPAAEAQAPWIEWEAYVRNGNEWSWVVLKTVDDTNGFTQSGMLQFVGPAGLASAMLFGKERVWLRAVNRDGRYGAGDTVLPTVTSIHRNAVLAVQQRTITNEYPETSKGGYVLSRAPVISQEVWIDETGFVGEHELSQFVERDADRYEIYRDSEGALQRLWVRWDEVQALSGSLPEDRHYTIQPATGFILFGNGVRGMALPQEGGDKVRVTYQVTDGSRGHVDAGQVRNIMHSLAFVNGVSNPAPAIGGGDSESLEGALLRGPQQLKHRGRAISASDVEWIVKETDPGILKVKCLANRNVAMAHTPGSIVVVALPSGGSAGKEHFPETKRRLEKALRSKASNLVASSGRLMVVPPAFLEISVIATLVVDSPDQIVPAEVACLEILSRFLNPINGQLDGRGWEIGEPVHASVFYGLLQSIKGVQRVEQLHLNVQKVEDGAAVEMMPDDIRQVLHGIVANGSHHRLNVVVS